MENSIANTFDDTAIRRNINNAIPQAMAEINRHIISKEDEDEASVDLGNWAIKNEKMIRLEDAGPGSVLLASNEVLELLLHKRRGDQIEQRLVKNHALLFDTARPGALITARMIEAR